MHLISSAKTKALAHLEMTRPYTMFHSGLLAVAGAELASSGRVAAWRVVLAALVTICGWEAGLYASDYYDRDIDARSKPGRPIPSQRVSPREAWWTMLGLITVGYCAALVLGVPNLLLAVCTTVLGIAYAKVFKSRALLGNFDRGVLGMCAVAFGALAGAGTVLSFAVALLAVLAILHDSATNLVGAIRDVRGDRAAGCATVPVVYGVPRATDIAVCLALGAVIPGTLLLMGLRANALAWSLFAGALVIAFRVYAPMWRARGKLTRTRALAAHKWLVVERLTLTSAVIAAFVPALITLVLLVLTGAASLVTQVLLRDRYEQQQLIEPAVDSGFVHG